MTKLTGSKRRSKSTRVLQAAVMAAPAVIAAAYMATLHRDGDESNGRVWSAAHGHWHDK